MSDEWFDRAFAFFLVTIGICVLSVGVAFLVLVLKMGAS